MNEPRPGKGLLVLDLDYSMSFHLDKRRKPLIVESLPHKAIVDTEPLLKGSLPTSHCLRPGLHEFLEKYVTRTYQARNTRLLCGRVESIRTTISPSGVR
jgi:hypothetical protein